MSNAVLNFLKRKHAPIYFQYSATECGIASLAMIFAYYKNHVSLEDLRDKCGVSRDGSRADTLIKVAKEYGYEAQAYSVDIDDIKKISHPVIAFWNFNHYVVINRAANNKFYINDPAMGAQVVSHDEFDKSFTGIIIVLAPGKHVRKVNIMPVLSLLIREWMRKYHQELIYISLCLFILACIPLLTSSLSTLFINYCVIYSNQNWILFIAAAMLILLMMHSAAAVYQKTIQFKLCAKASIVKSSEIIAHVLQLPLIFYSLRQKSEIITLLSMSEVVVNLLAKGVTNIFINTILGCLCLVSMIWIDIYLAEISLISVFISVCVSLAVARFNIIYEKLHINALGRWNMATMTGVRNMESIKICGLEQPVFKKWTELFINKLNGSEKINSLIIWVNTINKFLGSITTLSLFVVGGCRAARGYLSIGYFMGYYTLHLYFFNCLTGILAAIRESQEAYVSHARMNDISRHERDKRFLNKACNKTHTQNQKALTCNNINFYYNRMEPPTLNNIHISIKQGEHIALVGKSGSGKSTLAKLLCGLYRPDEGEILYDGRNVSTCLPNTLCQIFSYVSQDVSLFSGTIHENLVLWQESISHEAVMRAIHLACLDDVIAVRGLYGKVEEGGENFSGGEKQRLDIARALIQDTAILVLDEATSALDVQTEERLINNLKKLSKTIIYVAHRISTVMHCDQIYVLDNGKIIENGLHHQLISNKGIYYDLVQGGKNA
jgi:ABC-type bacteriocin/lantibiotic exporter with double-glycine peptidase domain